MRFDLDGLPVHFPYAAIYPEQHAYMGELKRALDARGHALLEMPTGTGKTAALLSLITSYALANPARPLRLVYCTRTVHEMEKTLAELPPRRSPSDPGASRPAAAAMALAFDEFGRPFEASI